jgi:hypothetical protein
VRKSSRKEETFVTWVFVVLCAFVGSLILVAIWRVKFSSKRDVMLEVAFKLTDLDYKPLAGVSVRLVFCCDRNWQSAEAGYRLVTDEKGEAKLTARVTLDRHLRKKPTNFFSSLVSLPQMTDHLAAGAELEYMDFHWLYVVDMERFPDGDVMQDDFSVYSRDTQGRFALKAARVGQDWKIKDLRGLMLTGPGHAPWNAMLAPSSGAEHWTLQLAFKKSPPAVRR